ncbi:MAG: 6-phosphofructokinase [Clostridiales Family XIII bacterium]|nr:6-phosphofructokinase [Clostridiales Family XIII bacterium]
MSNSNHNSGQRNMLIAQSGGPSAAVNASLAGAVAAGMASEKIGHVLGAVHGMQGLLDRRIVNISEQIESGQDIERLVHTPSMALGSSRYKIKKEVEEKEFGKITEILKEYDVGYFFYNGGNDSMDTVARLSDYFRGIGEDIRAIGIPKTVDNDLEYTDHTPGFGSAARYIATSVAEVYLDVTVYPVPTVAIIEIMGRNAGWLTAASALARESTPAPHLIYLPEVVFDMDSFLGDVEEAMGKHPSIVIAISEGIHYKNGLYVADTGAPPDAFGHKTLGGAAVECEHYIKRATDIPNLKTRVIVPNALQRVGGHVASSTDLEESYQCGCKAVEAAERGETGVMITIERLSDDPYVSRFASHGLTDIANKEKKVPASWINELGNDVTDEMVTYLKPLVRGEAVEQTKGGLPVFYELDRTMLVSPEDVSPAG